MTSLARAFAILDLFCARRSVWSVDELADALGYTRPTTYRYVRDLVATGLLARFGGGGYALGPRIVELDLLIRQADPLLSAGLPVIQDLVRRTGYDINLIGLYGERVVTIHQERGGEGLPLSYGRGRALPPFRGAGSKIILAYRPRPQVRRLYEAHGQEAEAAGFGESWETCRAALARLRHAGHAITEGELDAGFAGLAVPVFGPDETILGSVAAALTRQRAAFTQLERLADHLKAGAAEIGRTLANLHGPPLAAAPARRRA